MKFKEDILLRYMSLAPSALAFERYLECCIYLTLPFERPILDLGCGEGLFAHILFAEKIDTGIDPNQRELERARQLGAYEELIECVGSAVPKDNASYRTIFSNSVMEHIPDIEPVFREVHRLLVDGGNFYFTVPSENFERYSLISRLLRSINLVDLAKRYQKAYNDFWHQIHCYPLEQWQSLASRCGFEIVQSYTYNPARICSLDDALVPFSIPAYVVKRLANRWFLFPALRRFLVYPFYLLAQSYLKGGEKAEKGGLVYIAARKVSL